MSMLEDAGVVQVGESHRNYLAEVLAGDEFSERILGNLDYSVSNVLTTIPESECKDVDFHFGKMIPRRETVLFDWMWNFLAMNDDSCVLLFNVCAEKQDGVQFANVFFYHDRILNADKIVHVVFEDASEMQIAQSFKDAETSIVLVGAAIAGTKFRKSDLYNDVGNDLLFELLDSAAYLILGICDGEAWCFWPTRKQAQASGTTA